MTFVDWFIFLLLCYVILDFFCTNTTIIDEDEENIRNLTTVVIVPNDGVEDKPEDILPPYSPPTPKTQAAFADLPPSYDETWDITEAPINNNNNNNNITNDDTIIVNNSTINNTSNINNTNTNNTNNNIDINNLPSSYNVRSNITPDIVINPIHHDNTPTQQV